MSLPYVAQVILVLMTAPVVGSFVGVIVRRLPAGMPIAYSRSQCENCGHILSALDLAPILSFVWLRGRCRHCGNHIAKAHLGMELGALAVAVSAVWASSDLWTVWADCALGWTLLALACIDWAYLRLPDVLTLPLLLAGLGFTIILEPAAAPDHAAGAAVGYLVMRLLALGYRFCRGQDGLGGGDAKLVAAAGAWVGMAGLGPTIFIGASAGIVVTVLWGDGMRANTVVPFGAFLAFGTWVTRLYFQTPV